MSSINLYLIGLGHFKWSSRKDKVLLDLLNTLVPIISLSTCAGILLIGILIFLYIFLTSKDKLYLATLGIALPGFFFVVFELLVVITFFCNDIFWGRQFHRIQSLAICFYIFTIPYLILYLTPKNKYLQRFTKILCLAGLTIVLCFLIIAFGRPDLFVSQEKAPDQSVNLSWANVRGYSGFLFKLRDFIITPISLYMVVALLYEIIKRRSVRYLLFPVLGCLLAILFGYFDYLRLYGPNTGLSSIFTSNRYMSYYSIGSTFFAVFSMLGVARILLDHSKETAKAKRLEAVGMIAAGIAHDFNNMLTAILGNISLALSIEKDLTCKELLLDSQKASLQAKELTHQLLSFSKGGILTKKIGSTKEIIIETTNFILRGSKVKADFKIEADLKDADLDASLLTQLIQNTVLNAKQAMPGEGVIQIEAKNERPAPNQIPENRKAQEYILIKICNRGSLIPKNILKHIFESYFSTKKNGQGLGLFLVHSIVTNNDGLISVCSREKEGTIFKIFLPALKTQIKEIPSVKPRFAPKTNLRILFMDDDPNIRRLLTKLLAKQGYSVASARNSHETIMLYEEALKNNKPFDGIILDLTIPGESGGLETAQKIREQNKEIKIIASSGYSDDPVSRNPEAYGFNAFLAKPYTLDDFMQTLHQADLL